MSATMASSRASVVVLLVLATSVAVARSYAGGEAGPKYGGQAAAARTATGPENRLCGDGKRQSPIDVVTKQAVPAPNLDSLTRTYAAANATLVNDGRDVSMTFQGKVGTITVNGKVYNLERLQWHTPSEHTINGQRFPMELHLFHKSDAGDLAIIAILYQFGAPDSFHLQLKNTLSELGKDRCNFAEEDAQVAAGLIHMRSLQKRTGSYFRYSGSLTAPPCTENVVWNILGKVRQASKQQVALLESLLPANKRAAACPPQPLNGRTVQFYNPPNSTVSFQM